MSDLADARLAQTVLSEANDVHDTDFRLDHRFGDGFQSGDELTVREVRLLIDVLETHAGLDPDPERCWSRSVTAGMTDEREGLCRELAATGPTGHRLVDACERLLAAHGRVTLPTGDLVHGDFRFVHVALDLALFVHRRDLRPGIRNVSRLVERVEMLLGRAEP